MSTTYELLDPPTGFYAVEDPRLIPGDHVKVGFRVDASFRPKFQGEWMFLEVTAIEGDWPNAVYRGELCNTPFYIDPATLRVGQSVEFSARHIYEVVRDSPDRPEGERETPPG
jgi:hypothetical protein